MGGDEVGQETLDESVITQAFHQLGQRVHDGQALGMEGCIVLEAPDSYTLEGEPALVLWVDLEHPVTITRCSHWLSQHAGKDSAHDHYLTFSIS